MSGLSIGKIYEVSFSHANGLFFNPGSPGFHEGAGTAGGWQVAVDGTNAGLVSSTNDHSTPALEHTTEWQTGSVTFTATATTHDIRFVAFKPDGSQDPTFQFLDAVSVTRVPGPSRALLSILGLGAVCLRRRR